MASILNCHLITDENKHHCQLIAFMVTSVCHKNFDEYNKSVIKIKQQLNELLPKSSVPDDIYLMDHLPLTNNGKLKYESLYFIIEICI